jgi:hypothetical protein
VCIFGKKRRRHWLESILHTCMTLGKSLKFIRKEFHFQHTESWLPLEWEQQGQSERKKKETFPVPHLGNGNKNSSFNVTEPFE